MANPQPDKFTKISNELLEAIIRTYMSNYEHRIFWLIVRKTYGYNKKSDWISQTQIVEETGIRKQHVSRTIKKLYNKNMIMKIENKLAIQKDYDLWELPKQVTSNPNGLPGKVTQTGSKVTQMGVKSNPNGGTPKKKYTKESIEYKISEYLFEKIQQNNPNHKKPNLESWSKFIDLMIRIDKRTPRGIKEVIDWCQADSFWHKNILSTSKLRDKFDQLVMNMGDKKQQTPDKIAGIEAYKDYKPETIDSKMPKGFKDSEQYKRIKKL